MAKLYHLSPNPGLKELIPFNCCFTKGIFLTDLPHIDVWENILSGPSRGYNLYLYEVEVDESLPCMYGETADQNYVPLIDGTVSEAVKLASEAEEYVPAEIVLWDVVLRCRRVR